MTDTSLVFNILAKDKTKGGFDAVKGAALTAGVAAGAALTAGLVGAMDAEQANDRLAAQLGSSAQDAERLGQVAGNLYQGAWGESLGQVNDAIRGVIQNIAGMDEASYEHIQGVTASVLDLSTAFEQDLGGTTRAVGKLITTGLAEDATGALDLLTRGFQTGANQADDLLEAVSEYSTMFRDVGISGEQAFGLISQGLQGGARDADTVADAIKEFAIRAQDASTTSAAGFEALGLSAEDMTAAVAGGGAGAADALGMTLDKLRAMEDPVERNAAAVALFGTKAEDLGDALFGLDLDTAAAELGTVEGAAAQMGATLNDNARTVLTSFGRQAQAALVEKLAAAVPHIKAVGEWLSRHKAIMGPLVTVLGAFAVIVGTIIGISKVWAAVQTAVNIAMSLNPIGAIILAIIALIAIVVLMVKHWDKVVAFFKAAWQKIKQAFSAALNWIKNFVTSSFNFYKTLIANAMNNIKSRILGVWNNIKAGWKAALDWIKGRFSAARDSIASIAGKVVSAIKGIPGKIKSGFSALFNIITAPFRSAFNFVVTAWNNTIGRLSWSVPSWVPGIGGNSIAAPRLPYFHTGGVVEGTGDKLIMARGGEGVFTREQMAALGAGRTNQMTLNVRVGDSAAGRFVGQLLAQAVRTDPALRQQMKVVLT